MAQGNTVCSVWEDDGRRRLELQGFAQKALGRSNKCAALHDIIAKAAELARDLKSPADVMIDDLMAVLIGDGMLGGRNQGKYFVGLNQAYLGSVGFKPELGDPYFQVQHAMAGIVIGYRQFRPVQWLVKWQEEEEQDDRLYDATFPLGRTLSDDNCATLADRFKAAVCLGNVDNAICR